MLKAHQLSVEGSALSAPANADVTTLQAAQEAYTEAADLYEAAMGETVAGVSVSLFQQQQQQKQQLGPRKGTLH